MSRRLSAPRLIAFGFAALMLFGAAMLKLPASTQDGISWVDALFVSVSAASVTGLSSVDFSNTFTPFGDVVVMVLIQVGGLGIMTLATLGALLVGRRVGFRDLLAVREELGALDSPRNTLRLVAQIAGITFLVEIAGAVVLAAGFVYGGLSVGESVFQGVFHAIMAFCNSGFATLPQGLPEFAGNVPVNLALVALIVLGGFGFPVLVNLYHYRGMRRLTLHSKIVLVTTAALIVVGVVSVGALEWTNGATLGGEPLQTKLQMSLLQGVSPRTAGFSTVDYPQMRESTLLVQIALMFIGTAPTSTGGGVRVTTLALLFLVVLTQLRGQTEVEAFKRRIPRALIQKAFAVLSLGALLVLAGSLTLMISDGLAMLPAVFEITSAFATVGLSLNVTTELSAFGKLLVAATMFLGRVGPITLVLALTARQKSAGYAYPEEDIAIG